MMKVIKSNIGPNREKTRVRKIRDINRLHAVITPAGPYFVKTVVHFKFALIVFSQIGAVCEFLLWQRRTFGETRVFRSKKSLFRHILKQVRKENSSIDVYEFGVAHGFLTKFILDLETKKQTCISNYYGFDTFEGLPERYREFQRGSFTNHGKYPAIESNKLFWLKGHVEETVGESTFTLSRKLVIFDLDLYLPTTHVINKLIPSLGIGDILYFDEGFDEGEFRVIKENVMPLGVFECIGTTGQGIALVLKKVESKQNE
jgi:hypothetical protein